jgi:hypothetical protein
MASTPNYAWPTPDNTDPVADGALDMRTLGNAIDSTVGTLSGSVTSLTTTVGTLSGSLTSLTTTVDAIGATWLSYTPTVTPETGTITTLGTRNGKYMKIKKIVYVIFDVAITTNGTGGTYLNISKPLASPTPATTNLIGMSNEINIANYLGSVRDKTTTGVLVLGVGGAPGYMGANNSRITGFFCYESAT